MIDMTLSRHAQLQLERKRSPSELGDYAVYAHEKTDICSTERLQRHEQQAEQRTMYRKEVAKVNDKLVVAYKHLWTEKWRAGTALQDSSLNL